MSGLQSECGIFNSFKKFTHLESQSFANLYQFRRSCRICFELRLIVHVPFTNVNDLQSCHIYQVFHHFLESTHHLYLFAIIFCMKSWWLLRVIHLWVYNDSTSVAF